MYFVLTFQQITISTLWFKYLPLWGGEGIILVVTKCKRVRYQYRSYIERKEDKAKISNTDELFIKSF